MANKYLPKGTMWKVRYVCPGDVENGCMEKAINYTIKMLHKYAFDKANPPLTVLGIDMCVNQNGETKGAWINYDDGL